MSTTLTNGLKLPDKGSVDWYADMQNNYTILDGAVGTIADHTTAIAGKAASSHTHTKSDITDLLNSNFIPSANNTYDLGSSSYQWNNLYAKNYYYNGTAWGLDQANVWTNIQRMTSNPAVWYLRNNTVTLGTAPSSNRYIGMFFEDVNGADLGYASFQANKNGYNSIMFSLRNSDGTNAYTGALRYRASTTGAYCFFPETSECDLGISTNKWKTFNGINPGALSLPSSDSADYIDLSSNLSTNAEYQYTAPYDGWLCLYVIVNEFYTENAIGLYRSDTSANSHQWAKSVTAALNLYKQTRYQGSVMLPVESGKKYICYLSLNANTTVHGKYLFMYKNKGNV